MARLDEAHRICFDGPDGLFAVHENVIDGFGDNRVLVAGEWLRVYMNAAEIAELLGHESWGG